MSKMEVILNSEAMSIDEGSTLIALLKSLQLQRNGVAIEINGEFLKPDSDDDIALSHGDKIEIVRFVGGG